VMEMMDSDAVFAKKIDELRNGTNWKELKKKNKKVSVLKEKSGKVAVGDDESCEASSEESDSGRKKMDVSSTASSMAAAALPPIPGQRKRKIKKAVRSGKNSLSSIAMDESIYIPSNQTNLMSQSFNDSSTRRGTFPKRKLDKLRMNRSFSDHFSLNLNKNQMTNSFSSQKSATSDIFGSVFTRFEPLMTSTMKRQGSRNLAVRRSSMDSLASTTSSGTVHETGDANYEWDDYKDPPSLPDMSDVVSFPNILENIDVDEDYQLQLTTPDLLLSTINESKTDYFNIRRLIDDYSALDEEKEDIRSALRMSAKKSVSKLTAIVQGIPRSNLNREQINDLENLQKQWKWTLDELGTDPTELEREKDWENVKHIQSCGRLGTVCV
uniref:Uncharacterized protein n=1 Tax=Panagrolaimus sp. JU765 TaxID=591449 RepID=A0AC34PVP1_9BILA